MRNPGQWRPSKYTLRGGRLRATHDVSELNVSSRMAADVTAAFYDRALPVHARGKLLDLGCGKVPLFIAYERFIKSCICVDWKNTRHPNPFIDQECDLTKPLPFANNEFDTIILSSVLEHISKPEPLWREMNRVLSIGGKILLSVPFMYWLHERPYDFYRYTEFALRRFAEESGFKLIELSSTGGAPEVITDVFAKSVADIPVLGFLLAVLAQSVIISLRNKTWARRRATSSRFPLGYFLIAEKTVDISAGTGSGQAC